MNDMTSASTIITSLYKACESTGVRVGIGRKSSDAPSCSRKSTISLNRKDVGVVTVMKDSDDSFILDFDGLSIGSFTCQFEDITTAAGFLRGFLRAERLDDHEVS